MKESKHPKMKKTWKFISNLFILNGNENIIALFLYKIVFIGVFLFYMYEYYLQNNVGAFFTTFIPLPFINQIAGGYVWIIVWVIIAAICFGIWKLVDILADYLYLPII